MAKQPLYRALRGMPDILPETSFRMRVVEDIARDVFTRFGFGEIRTPYLEETEVFTRSIGEDTDIVGKEMYSFEDRGGKSVSLRPEGTASVIRAYIENLYRESGLVKLFYTGPMFRGERPQKGRLRQFHQIGAEMIGASDPFIDAELILSLRDFLGQVGAGGFKIQMNSLGCSGDRENYKKVLKDHLSGYSDDLCENCRRRVNTNVLRVLDCKVPDCREVVSSAPRITEYLCDACTGAYDDIRSLLSKMDVPFEERPDLVRGLDYYTGTVFEVVHPALGAQDALAAGGRYDGLTARMGGQAVGATGYAVGVERLLMVLEGGSVPLKDPGVLVAAMDDTGRSEAFFLAEKLRRSGIKAQSDLSGRSFKAQMRRANRESMKFVMILGETEIEEGKITLKDMEKGEQVLLSREKAIEVLKRNKRDRDGQSSDVI